MELLEDEADFFRAVTNEIGFAEARDVLAVHGDAAGCGGVEAAENIDEGGFAGAGRAHESDPFAGLNVEADAVEGAECAVFFDQIFEDNLRRRLRGGRERGGGIDERLSGHAGTGKSARLRRRPLQRPGEESA